jgi:hypothetical protein
MIDGVCLQFMVGNLQSVPRCLQKVFVAVFNGNEKQSAESKCQRVKRGLDRRAREDGRCSGDETTVALFNLHKQIT